MVRFQNKISNTITGSSRKEGIDIPIRDNGCRPVGSQVKAGRVVDQDRIPLPGTGCLESRFNLFVRLSAPPPGWIGKLGTYYAPLDSEYGKPQGQRYKPATKNEGRLFAVPPPPPVSPLNKRIQPQGSQRPNQRLQGCAGVKKTASRAGKGNNTVMLIRVRPQASRPSCIKNSDRSRHAPISTRGARKIWPWTAKALPRFIPSA